MAFRRSAVRSRSAPPPSHCDCCKFSLSPWAAGPTRIVCPLCVHRHRARIQVGGTVCAWFDPIGAGIRERMRGFIRELLEQELAAALGRGRSERTPGEPKGHRNGTCGRQLLGSFCPIAMGAPRVRMAAADGTTTERRSAAPTRPRPPKSAAVRSCASGGCAARRWPPAWKWPGIGCSPFSACPRASGGRPGPPTPSGACTRRPSAASRPRPCRPQQRRRPCRSGATSAPPGPSAATAPAGHVPGPGHSPRRAPPRRPQCRASGRPRQSPPGNCGTAPAHSPAVHGPMTRSPANPAACSRSPQPPGGPPAAASLPGCTRC